MLSPGVRFGPYEIGSPVGSGGMGEVYRARDTRLDRVVALKVISQTLIADSQALQRFEREARAIAALNHPNICTIHDVGATPEHARFIVMELLEGETLRRRLERGPLDVRALIDMAIALTSALDAAHKKGIVHRDIKTSNIFLTMHGPKVLDFGLATAAAEPMADASRETMAAALTEAGTTVGTVAYMSPEQLRADVLDARTDLFSFGAVLYEMATGRQAFRGGTTAVIANAIFEKTPRPVRQDNPTLPLELERIIDRTLEKDRELRYQSAADLRSDLERLKRDVNSSVSAAVAPDEGARPSRRTPGRAVLVGGLVTALLVVSAAAYWYLASNTVITSLAVLPFTHGSSDANTEYLSSGISEGLINSLSQLPGLRVLSRNAVLTYSARDVDPRQVGRELQVQSVLTGRVTPDGDTLDIQSELVDVASGAQLWGQRYRRPLSALITLQDEIAREISGTLRLTLTQADERRLARRYPENTEAYRLYLRGRYYFDQRTADGTRRSIESFQEAIKQDPDYALAYAGLANAYVPSDTVLPPAANVVLAKSAAVKALASDDSLAEVQTAVGRVLQHCDWDWAGAERAFKRAIELDPRNAEAHHMYSHYLTPMGRFDESVTEAQTALELDPLDVLLNVHLAWAYLHARRYDEAIAQSLKAIAMDPNLEVARTGLGRAYLGKKMYQDALAEFQKTATLAGGVATGPDTYLGYTSAVMGMKTAAVQKLAILRERYTQGQASAYDVAVVYTGLAETDQALEWLEKAFVERSGGLLQIKADLMFDTIRSDARFASIVGRLGLPSDPAPRP